MLSPIALASDCGWNSERSNYNCDSFFSGAAAGASVPLVGDTLEGNPAALPVTPTPFGLEGIFSHRSAPRAKPGFMVSTVKGFEGIGFGVGSWSEGTFGAPDFPNHFLGSSAWREYQEYQRDPPSTLGIRLSFGGSLGFSRVRGRASPQVGALMKFFFLGLGYSESYEKISNLLPKTKISTISAGLPLGPFYAGFSRIRIKSSVNKTYVNVYGIHWGGPKWTLFGNVKIQRDHRGDLDHWWRAGIQRRLGKRFGLGYEYGLYRYSHSAVLQLFL